MIKELKEAVSNNPNDQELGKIVRNLFVNNFDDIVELDGARIDKFIAIKEQAFEDAARARNKEKHILSKLGLAVTGDQIF